MTSLPSRLRALALADAGNAGVLEEAADTVISPEVRKRFWSHVDCSESSGCWIWIGYKSKRGYGKFYFEKSWYRAHRFSYLMAHGGIDPNLTIDHLCRNTACVNPSHLEQVTNQENIRRGGNSLKTHCPQGHPFSGSNLVIKNDGLRRCRICLNDQSRASKAKRRRETP